MNTTEEIYLTQRARDDLITHVDKPIVVSRAAKPKFRAVGRVENRKRKYKEVIDKPITPGADSGLV